MAEPAPKREPRAYEPVAEIAKGGMGRVELVVRRQGAFARLYALKRLRPELADDEAVRGMFVDEARIAGLIRHPNVVAVLDVGEDEDGPYLVMDYIEGVSLFEIISASAKSKTPVPLADAVSIAREAALGLAAAHDLEGPGGKNMRVVHRDISPQNILVGYDGLARVTDFGVAHALERRSETVDGALKGKIGYMSPEQLQYEPIDARSDLFAFGVVLYETIAGRRLYAGSQTEAFARILREPPPDLRVARPDAPESLAALVGSLLAKDRAQRPASAREVARTLESIGDGLRTRGERADVVAYLESVFAERRAKQRELVSSGLERTKIARSMIVEMPVDRAEQQATAPLARALDAGTTVVMRERVVAPVSRVPWALSAIVLLALASVVGLAMRSASSSEARAATPLPAVIVDAGVIAPPVAIAAPVVAPAPTTIVVPVEVAPRVPAHRAPIAAPPTSAPPHAQHQAPTTLEGRAWGWEDEP